MSLTLSALLLLAVPVAEQPPSEAAHPVSTDGIFIESQPVTYAQVRIERRVIIRVPRRRTSQTRPMADIRSQLVPQKYSEKKIGKCLPMNNILGVQMYQGRELDLVTRDRKRIRARLEKKCQARSFYSGFYMEKSKDGKICVDRDMLHSRTGSKCEIDRFRQLVPE
ncbi:MAG: hypothetical protein Pars2KO_24770 [Parasphingorhabdus sp.]